MASVRTIGLAGVDTLIRPRDLDDAVEVTIASPASRWFPTRRTSSLGVVLKLGPAHSVKAEGRQLTYPASSICVRRPGCVWSSEDTGPSGFLSIDIAPDALPEDGHRGGMVFARTSALPDLRTIVRVLLSQATRLEKDEAVSTLVAAVSARGLVEWPELADRAPSIALDKARAFLDESLESNPSLDDVARTARLNKHVLVRRFRERYGTTPHAYLMLVKTDRARELLARGVRAGEVATTLGFSDQAHLTRTFRNLMGLGPAAYQRRVRAIG